MSDVRHVRKKVEAFCNRRGTRVIPFTRMKNLMEKLRLHNVSMSHFRQAISGPDYEVKQNKDGSGVLYVK